MDTSQKIVASACGALAGIVTSIIITIGFWIQELSPQETIFRYHQFPDFELLELAYTLPSRILLGLILGALMGIWIIFRRREQIGHLRTWLRAYIWISMLVLAPWILFLFLFWIAAWQGISSAGRPSEWPPAIIIVVLIGLLAGSSGGLAGGFVFTRYGERLSAVIKNR